jgi:signal transduction histidine kinase/ligand-binding sensor domain-containing protein
MMRRTRNASVAGFLLLLFFAAGRAQHDFQNLDCLSMDDGLSDNQVVCIAQDRRGFMWFGTDRGLNRFDGFSFTTYLHDPANRTGIADNKVTALYEDRRQALWIGTSAGLHRFNYEHELFEDFPLTNDAGSAPVISVIFEDQHGTLWVGTEGQGLFRWNITAGKFEPITITGWLEQKITALCDNGSGGLWIGSPQGLLGFDSETNTVTTAPENIRLTGINALYQEKNGRLWIGHQTGVEMMSSRDAVPRHYPLPVSESSLEGLPPVSAIYQDWSGKMWVGTAGAGIFYLDAARNRFVHFRPCKCLKDTGGLSSTGIHTIFQSRNGTMWVGTREGIGKFSFRTRLFKKYQYEKDDQFSLCQGEVKTISQDRNGMVWIGTWGNGICRLDIGLDRIYRNEFDAQISSRYISAIAMDDSGYAWIATGDDGTLHRMTNSGERLAQYTLRDREGVPVAFTAVRASGNELWLGTVDKGVYVFDKLRREFRPPGESTAILDGHHIYCLYSDASGNWWFGSEQGIYRYRPGTGKLSHFHTIPNEESQMGGDAVYAIFRDRHGKIWLGTNHGLIAFSVDGEVGKFGEPVDEKDGLSGEEVYGILEDKRDMLWLLTNKGLSRYHAPSNQVRNYTTEDGCVKFTKKLTHGANAYLKTAQGHLLFGGVNGLTLYDDKGRPELDMHPPEVVITGLKLNNESLIYGKNAILKKSLTESDSVAFSSRNSNLSIEFAVLDYTEPSQNQYAYMLEGWDADWIYSGTQHVANYAVIPPGAYTFRAKGATHAGLWNNDGVHLKLTIYPLLWETWWFRTLAVVGLLSIIVVIYFVQIRKARKEQEAQTTLTKQLLESQEGERRRIAAELHDSLGQNLLLINNELTQLQLSPRKKTGQSLTQISDMMRESINEVREIAYDLHPHQLEQLGLRRALESAIKKVGRVLNARTVYSLDEIDSLLSEANRIHFYRIIQEALNNIYKHSAANELIVEIERRDGHIEALIRDNGHGFKGTGMNGDHAGHGLGIANMYERAKLIGGEIQLESTPGHGTTIRLHVPVEQ